MRIGILGGGLAGLVVSSLLDSEHEITILESEKSPGGLARSHHFMGFNYDIGPHIMFSKKKEVLDYMLSFGNEGYGTYRRSNQIWYKGKLIKYPFENFLGLLPEEEKNECVHSFINNPYEDYAAGNMLQFFLKTFGPGITNTYLRPYNEKIWKFDPSYLDLQMVGRIPKPPKEDIIKGAEGNFQEGYTHQLNFYYPKKGGIQYFIDQVIETLPSNTALLSDHAVKKVQKTAKGWKVLCQNEKEFEFDQIVNCMPLHILFSVLDLPVPEEIKEARSNLRYNSLYYGLAVFSEDEAGDNFAFNIPHKEIIFHRLSKVNFIGEDHPKGKSAFLFEVTYRENSSLAEMTPETLQKEIIQGMSDMGIIQPENLLGFDLKKIKYAYVIYDLDHRKNTDTVLGYLRSQGIRCCGRFAEHEYVNMDQVIESAMRLTRELNPLWSSPEKKSSQKDFSEGTLKI